MEFSFETTYDRKAHDSDQINPDAKSPKTPHGSLRGRFVSAHFFCHVVSAFCAPL